MRLRLLLPILLLVGCSDEGMTRTYSMSRDSAPETMAGIQMPLSAPPSLTMRPTRPSSLGASSGGSQANEASADSAGQNALLDAAGPPADANIRTVINENSGLVYPDAGFVDQLMSWQPPPGTTPVFTQAGSNRGWFSRLF